MTQDTRARGTNALVLFRGRINDDFNQPVITIKYINVRYKFNAGSVRSFADYYVANFARIRI